ncbi:hypothetical protein PAAG_08212, partial [Paracoccidioides lutzii Pb01]
PKLISCCDKEEVRGVGEVKGVVVVVVVVVVVGGGGGGGGKQVPRVRSCPGYGN